MEQETRAMARRHMWLSWWGGMWVVWATGLVWISYLLVTSYHLAFSSNRLFASTGYSLLCGAVSSMFFLGLPALLGAFVRQPLIRWVFANASSPTTLLLYVVLAFALSVAGLTLVYMFGAFLLCPGYYPEPVFTAQLFFGLSLPWLLSSVAVAWWLCRGRWRATKTAKNPAVSN